MFNTEVTTMITYHSSKWNGPGGMIVDGNEVDEESCPTNNKGQEES